MGQGSNPGGDPPLSKQIVSTRDSVQSEHRHDFKRRISIETGTSKTCPTALNGLRSDYSKGIERSLMTFPTYFLASGFTTFLSCLGFLVFLSFF